ncbi:helix-turn-helix domain-containing protein [Oscillibacter sp.]|uniref:helix-turn-helix domain-containing protein n=1 Tax=Oscillibacter sp. TaxID=1945593 RepID=UPI00261259BC|nr:helix-turn-helix domain-containing protein [Oscillibacter sp.]MDD3347173.1 helix-turn-helix domain-containing protein [Oscillibacter sp.]
MNHYVTGTAIRELREKKKLTQRQLAETLCVSDKTVSKWETGRGLPDISLLEPISGALGVSVAELLSGECVKNANRSANVLRSKFYVCPVCGNVIWCTGEGAFSCCGVSLPPLEAEEPDEAHAIHAEVVENEWYVTVDHPMEKSHSVTFLAFVTSDRAQIVRLYPEQDAQTRFFIRGQGYLYAYCNRHGLFRVRM